MKFVILVARCRISSNNDARLAATGRRYRGGRTDQAEDNHRPGIAPSEKLDNPSSGIQWLGLGWSEWQPIGNIDTFVNSGDIGL